MAHGRRTYPQIFLVTLPITLLLGNVLFAEGADGGEKEVRDTQSRAAPPPTSLERDVR